MLEVHNAYLSPAVTEGFSHTFHPGQISVVLGPNQSGKTDLCRLIAGLNTRARGAVLLNGLDLSAHRVQQRSVAMVYQAFVNYPNLSVFDNIASPLRARGFSSAALHERVDELANKMQIAALLCRAPHELSGGQQQRLAIARALAKEAQVLLLDEPLVNLDFKLREALEVELRDLLHAQNTVVIYTSSDPRDAFNLGDEVLLLAGGEKLQAGTPLEVYQQPRNLAAMTLLADPQVNCFEREGAACALRPEHIQVGHPKTPSDLHFAMQVTACETSGDESFIHGEVAGQGWVVRSRGMLRVSAGDQVDLCATAADVVRF